MARAYEVRTWAEHGLGHVVRRTRRWEDATAYAMAHASEYDGGLFILTPDGTIDTGVSLIYPDGTEEDYRTPAYVRLLEEDPRAAAAELRARIARHRRLAG